MPTQNYRNKYGDKVPGTTTIISQNLGWNKQALMWWANQEGQAGRNHRESAQHAADAGTLAHKMAECDITGREFAFPEKMQSDIQELAEKAFGAYLNWKRRSQVHIFKAEIPLVSEKYQFGGTLDGIGMIDNHYCLIDFKTSNGTYADHLIQLAAYQILWEENYESAPLSGGFHLLRFGKTDGSFHDHWYPELLKPNLAFQCLRELHDLKRDIEKAT